MASRNITDDDEQAGLRRVFLEPSWREQSPREHTQLLLSQDEQTQRSQGRPYDASERLYEPEDEPGLWRLRTAQRLDAYRSYSPPKNLAAMHWSRRPVPPGPAASLTRSVRPSDVLAWADASAARGAGYATNGDWRAAFRSYIVAAELLAQLLNDVEPHPELRDRARRRMDVVMGIAEEIREQHPQLLLLKPSQPALETVVASAWAELDETAADARSTLAREENRAGNAQLKTGNNAEAVARYTASLELDPARPHVYGNRSVAFLRMDDLRAAVRDARAAVDLEPEAVARRAGVPLRRGVDSINARSPDQEDGVDASTIEASLADAQRRFSQEVAQEVAMLRACSIDAATVQLIECAELGDPEGLLRALGEGAKIDWGNPGWLDYTALHMASLHGHIEIARLLLTAGANVAVVARDGSRPLHLAASSAVAVLLAEQPYADCEVRDRDGLTPVQRASELLYEEGDVLICRAPDPVDITAAEIGREAAAGSINVHSKDSCLQSSIDPRHFRLCLVCERVRRKGGDGNDSFLARWYHAQPCTSAGRYKASVNTTYALDAVNASVFVDRTEVYRRLRTSAACAHAKGSLVVRGVTLKSRGGQEGKDAATMAGAAAHSDATAMPEEMVLTDEEWVQVVQTIIGSARSVINERRRELEAAARSSIRDEEDRNAVFELACFTPQTILAYGCKAGARVCLLLADGRPARLPSGAVVCSVAVASDPSPVLTPKMVELATATARQVKNEATLMVESGTEPGEWCPPQPTGKTDNTMSGETRLDGKNQAKSAFSGRDDVELEATAPVDAAAVVVDSKAKVAVAVGRNAIDKLQKESVVEQNSTTFDVGLLPIAELFPDAEAKAVASPTLPPELVDSGEVGALIQGVSCSMINYGSFNLPRGAYGGGTAFGWGARYTLAKPVDAKGFKAPTRDDSFLTLRLNAPGSDLVSGGVRVVVKFLLDQRTRYYNTELSVSTDPSRPWAV